MTAAIDLYDPDTYVVGPPHEWFAEMRSVQPVYWQDIPRQTGYWALLKHADCVHVAKNPLLFSAETGGVVLETLSDSMLELMRGQLLAMDPPRHPDYRRPLAPHFKAKVIAGLEPQIREVCRGIMADAQAQGELDYVKLTSTLPSQVVGVLMGLPREDWSRIHQLAQMITSGTDPDINPDGPGYGDGGSSASREMVGYAIALAARRRQEAPHEDLTTVLLETEFGGRFMDDLDFAKFFMQLVTAGNDTTRTLLSSGLLLLLEHPDQLAAMRADRNLIPGAVEEMLRVENPLHYFRRTATADTVINGTEIKAGDKVAMYYTSANRDEDVFVDPQRFDIERNPNPHLSFGIAQHFCLGVHLARLEARAFFEELLHTFSSIELVGEVTRTRSNLNNALKSMPVRLC